MLEVDCDQPGSWPDAIDWPALASRAVAAALAADGFAPAIAAADVLLEVAVRLSDDAEVRTLNRDYRKQDKPTNILSFPMLEGADVDLCRRATSGEHLLGDLVLAAETATREANEKSITLAGHVTHLLVHGTLHLLGHDHQDDAEAEAMEALEVQVLAGLGIADPYALPESDLRALP